MTSAIPEIATRVVRWQKEHGRNHLPWQNTRDAYRVWLSEIMLQQTQVATVLDYYARFLERFPDVKALAAAPQDEVLALWSGLGYYSRARNLHKAAQQVVSEFGGEFPHTVELLSSLPGIGRSTAGAIASFCFGERSAILDANVRRVLTRVLGFDADLAVASNERRLWALADQLLPVDDLQNNMPRYTQGMMDLGAGICTPRSPACLLCPLESVCVARRNGHPENYPVRTRTLKRSAHSWWLLLARDEAGRLWLERRPQTGIWAGLYCPPVFDERALLEHAAGSAAQLVDLPVVTHVLTHRDLYLHPVVAEASARPPRVGEAVEGAGFFAPSAWADLGLPAPVRKLLATL
ncbi:A/G-specific adenine glycosylase [Diaphorobacter aerolatus]|uniref:Adenine DNA glycosylase n=1 Tax=Diaphorobacter aerolatus TaxID=1288495 RepID=A0A7H0GIB9_9BURK|nr:A/G-specific adenine glycosylase [Diaphorobacter aerolatus]QNP48035.1 A/G-specific adenine glycosylase [Diaphorobacter aerolatus]